MSCDADSVSTYCNQGYKAKVLENGHHPHVLLFSKISQKTIGKQELSDLHEFVGETQNQLEMCLPPAFFNIMTHLMIQYNDTSHDSHGSSDTGARPLLLA